MDKIDISQEYSDRFDQLRRNRVETSFYKYGPARKELLYWECPGNFHHGIMFKEISGYREPGVSA